MFRLKKNLVYFAVAVFLLVLLCSAIAPLRTPLLNTLKLPFSFLALMKREAAGIILYHRNFIQNERSKKEISLLRQKLITLDEISLENTRLRNLLSLKQKSPLRVIVALVIGRSPDNWSSLVIIDKGRYNGIKEGMVAISYLGLVGRVMETASSTSKIMLINDPNFSVSALVQRSRQEGLISGSLGSSLVMRYLPKEADIKAADTIVTSGLTDLYPKGLLIGKVMEVGEEFSGLSRYAIIKPAVELSNLEEVLVVAQ